MVKYTEKLLEKGEERKRLTKQLAALVGAVAEDIAQSLPEGTKPSYEGKEDDSLFSGPWWAGTLGLKVVRIRSNISEANFLGHYDMFNDEKLTVFVSDREPGTRFFLDNDPRGKVYVASAGDYLNFANSLPEIVAGFEKKADELSQTLRKAFDDLKELAKTEGELV